MQRNQKKLNQFFKYRPFHLSIVYLLLISQLWVYSDTYCHWMIDSESDLIELCKTGDSETEEENKKEKKDKIRIDLHSVKFENFVSTNVILHAEYFLSLHHPEITTPPPEFFA